MRILHLQHSTYQHQYHIVWGTKYRRKYLKDYVRSELRRSIYQFIKQEPTLYLHALNTDQDHVHLQLEIPPTLAVATVVQRMKIHTAKHLKKKFPFIKRIYLDNDIWSVGYFSSTIGLNEQMIERYIASQGKKELPQVAFEFSATMKGNPGTA